MIELDEYPTPKQQARIAELSSADIEVINAALLSVASQRWQKLAKVIGLAMGSFEERFNGIPDVFFSRRAKVLIDNKRLVARGDPAYMCNCEIKLA